MVRVFALFAFLLAAACAAETEPVMAPDPPSTRLELCQDLAEGWCAVEDVCGTSSSNCVGEMVFECCGQPLTPEQCQVPIDVEGTAYNECLDGLDARSCGGSVPGACSVVEQ